MTLVIDGSLTHDESGESAQLRVHALVVDALAKLGLRELDAADISSELVGKFGRGITANDVDDAVLVTACLRRNARAVSLFVRTLGPVMRAAASRVVRGGDAIDECVQRTQTKLLVGDDRPARLGAFLPGGSLAGWVQVVTVRESIDFLRAHNRDVPMQSVSELCDALPAHDPELESLKTRYRQVMQEAFRRAVAALSSDARTLLQEHVVEGRSIDEMADKHGVDRSTIARWLLRSRQELADAVRDDVLSNLGLSGADYESVLRLVRSQLDISVSSL